MDFRGFLGALVSLRSGCRGGFSGILLVRSLILFSFTFVLNYTTTNTPTTNSSFISDIEDGGKRGKHTCQGRIQV